MKDPLYTTSVKLSPEQKADLERSKKSITDSRRELGILKKLGMDVRMLEEKLTWADEVQSTLLKEFSE